MQRVTVKIPATTANLGPGFDCLGLALGLYHTVTFSALDKSGIHITACGEDKHKIPLDNSNLVAESAEIIFRRVGRRPTGLDIYQENGIPIGSGLGSSSSAVLAGMFAANALLDSPLTREQILQLATNLEGHPDNVAPAVYGGLILGVQEPEGLLVERILIPALKVVVVLPDFHLLTTDARAALPYQVPLKDAIFNTSRIALLTRALETADYTKLRIAMQDRLHQPYRIPLIPGMADAFEAAYAAGAAGVAISGAGPSLIAFAPADHEVIGRAVTAVFTAAGLSSRTWILPVDTQGVCIRVH